MHALIVRREVILTKRCLEVLDAVLLSKHLAESTNRCYNSGAGASTTITYLQTELYYDALPICRFMTHTTQMKFFSFPD